LPPARGATQRVSASAAAPTPAPESRELRGESLEGPRPAGGEVDSKLASNSTGAMRPLDTATGTVMSVVQTPAGTEVSAEGESEAGDRDTRAMGLAYANTINPTSWFFGSGSAYTFADDCYLAGTDRSMLQYELVLWNYHGGSGKSCTVTLWSGTTAGGPTTVIGGTSRTVTLATASTVQTFTQTFSGITLPNLVFAAFDTNNDNIRLPYAGPVELGSSDNLFWARTESTGVWVNCAGGTDPAFAYNTWFRIWVNTLAVCGNGIREGTEQCDGTDNANCLGTACKSDCTCSCVVTCPGGAHIENEPCGASVNGSCPNAESIACGVPVCGTSYSTTSTRDTDWYKVTTTGYTKYTMTITAEFGVIAGLAEYNPGYEGSGNCNETTGYISPYMTAGPCEEKTLNIPCMPGGIYWFWVSKGWEDWPCSNPYGEIDYVMTVDCVPCYSFCPANTLFGQPVAGADESWTAGVSDFDFGYIRYEEFWELYGEVCDLHWWGVTGGWGGGNTRERCLDSVTYKPPWSPCIESPMEFQIQFYQDAGGQPGVIARTYNVLVAPVNTGDLYQGFPLYYFSTTLTPCVPPGLYNGWVSIQAVDTTPEGCYFLWMSADETDGKSLLFDGTDWTTEAFDLSLCITGTPIDPLGACCDTTFGTAECFDNFLLSQCTGPGLRFQAGVDCDHMTPPCGWGTCCCPGVYCPCMYFENEPQCTSLGCTWHDPAEGLLCEPINPCPCVLDCPPGSVPEAEDCGADTNGGCDGYPPHRFETIACNSTVCGTAWCDGRIRDTDWYVFTLTEPKGVSWQMTAEFPSLVHVIDAGSGSCADYTILGSDTAGVCQTAEVTVSLAAGTYWLWAGPRDMETIVTCGDNDLYYATLTSAPPGACCFQDATCDDELSEQDCDAQGGNHLGPDTQCTPNPCGACCFQDGGCEVWDDSGCLGHNGVYVGVGTDCTRADPCPKCPGETLFGQPAALQPSGEFPSEAFVSDEAYGDRVYESFSGVAGDTCDLHWWGTHAWWSGKGWGPCVKEPDRFNVRFYADDGTGHPAEPPVCAYLDVVPQKDATGFSFGAYPVYYYSVTLLQPCCSLAGGWVSVEGVQYTGTPCAFLWVESPFGDGQSLTHWWDGRWTLNPFDLAICLTPALGACCTDSLEPPNCEDGMDEAHCQGPDQRFAPGEFCANDPFDPPCGTGACCDDYWGTCEDAVTEPDCSSDCSGFTRQWAPGELCTPDPFDPACAPTGVCADSAYRNGPYNCVSSLRAQRRIGDPAATCWVVDDVTLSCKSRLVGVHWWTVDNAAFRWNGTADLMILAPDGPGGGPGTVLHEGTGLPCTRQPTGDYHGGDPVYLYTLELHVGGGLDPIALVPGTYWLGVRPVETPSVGGRSEWLTADLLGQCVQTDCGAGWVPACPHNVAFCLHGELEAFPPSGVTDATQAHPISALTPCTGIGQADGWEPITIDLGVSGADDLTCWALCETGFSPACGPNFITSVVEGPPGVYTINLAHGISAYDVNAPAPAMGVGHVTTIRYNGGSYVRYFKHPANVDGSSLANAQDIIQIINCINEVFGGASRPRWECDLDQSGTITVADMNVEINLLNGAGLYDIWFNTPKPTGAGCP